VKRLAVTLALLVCAPAAAHDIHADPAARLKLLRAGTALQQCAKGCHRTRKLRVLSLHWSVGCTLKGKAIRHHWEVGLRTALGAGEGFGSGPFWVDGVSDPAHGADPQDPLFEDAPELLADYADRVKATGGKLRVGVKPGSVIRPHIAASCLTTVDGDGSDLERHNGRTLIVPPKAALAGTPHLRAGHAGRVVFDLSPNASSLLHSKGSSGAVLHAGSAKRSLTAGDIASGDTGLRVTPRAGTLRAWVTFGGVRSANTLHLAVR
jgi:hypothetical protein